MKHLRPSAGIRDLPNGPKMYQGFLEYYTSMADITPCIRALIIIVIY